ncbi:AAA family ATPase, partial [Streptococcus sobrinus]
MELKIKHLTIKNIKNVKFGEIDFTNSKKEYLNVTGIYGQNGSGKTTVVEVFEIIKELLSGEKIPKKTSGIFSDDFENPSEIILEVKNNDQKFIKYAVQFFATTLNDEQSVAIIDEKVLSKEVGLGKRYKTIVHYSVTGVRKDSNGDNKLESKLYSKKTIATRDAVEIISSNSFSDSTSFLFRDNFLQLMKQKKASLGEVLSTINSLRQLSSNFRIYTSEFSGMISGNNMALVGINIKNGKQELHGIIPFSLQQGGM